MISLKQIKSLYVREIGIKTLDLDTYLSDMLHDVVHPSKLKYLGLSTRRIHDDIELSCLVRVGSLVPSTAEKIVIRIKDWS